MTSRSTLSAAAAALDAPLVWDAPFRYGRMSYFNPPYRAVLQGALPGLPPPVFLFLALHHCWQAGLTGGRVT